jgi:hypothetical protein
MQTTFNQYTDKLHRYSCIIHTRILSAIVLESFFGPQNAVVNHVFYSIFYHLMWKAPLFFLWGAYCVFSCLR